MRTPSLAAVTLFLFAALPVWAQDTLRQNAEGNLSSIGSGAYGQQQPPGYIYTVIGQILGLALAFVGIVFVVITLQGGFIWMTAGGNEESLRKARNKIINGAIGAIVVFGTYIISAYVLSYACQFFVSASVCGA